MIFSSPHWRLRLAECIWTKGEAALEVKQAYSQALALCRQVDQSSHLFPVMWGLWAAVLVEGELQSAHELGEQLLRLAHSQQDSGVLVEAHFTLEDTLFWLGQLDSARIHFEQGIALYNPYQHHDHAFSFGQDPGVWCLSYATWILWALGYPDQALERSLEALTLAQKFSHPYSLSLALYWSAGLHCHRREERETQKQAEVSITLCNEQGFPMFTAFGMVLRGWALAEQGWKEEGLNQIQEGIAAWRATEANIASSWFLALLAEVQGKAGRVEEGLNALAEALVHVDITGEHVYEAELHRLKGELTLERENQKSKGKRQK